MSLSHVGTPFQPVGLASSAQHCQAIRSIEIDPQLVVGLMNLAQRATCLNFSLNFRIDSFLIFCLQGSIVPDPVLWREAARMEVESRRKQEWCRRAASNKKSGVSNLLFSNLVLSSSWCPIYFSPILFCLHPKKRNGVSSYEFNGVSVACSP